MNPPKLMTALGHTSRHLVDDEVVDLTNVLAGRSVNLSTLDVFARNAFVVGMADQHDGLREPAGISRTRNFSAIA
jgi:hypothetical protein